MGFHELKTELSKFVFEETRTDSGEYFEAVITKNELTKLTPVLVQFLGQPVSSLVEALLPQEQAMVKELGGIMSGQTLYWFRDAKEVYFAMLWPWSGGSLITIRIGKKEAPKAL
jgi:hypothetical protein